MEEDWDQEDQDYAARLKGDFEQEIYVESQTKGA